MERLAISRVEAAQMLGVSVRTLDTMIARKEIHGRRIGRRIVFTLEELRRFLAKDHPLPTKAAG
jgi:excisionase family DNA binding protein